MDADDDAARRRAARRLAALLAFRPRREPRGAGRRGRGARRRCTPCPSSSSTRAQPFLERRRCSRCCCAASCGSSASSAGRRRRRWSPWSAPRWPASSSRRAWTPTRPWLDYEQIAQSLAPRRRDALRLGPQLRAAGLAARRARGAAHPGARGVVLEGDEPRAVRRRALAPGDGLAGRSSTTPRSTRATRSGSSRCGSSVRNLRTREFIGAGTIEAISRSPRLPVRSRRRACSRRRRGRCAAATPTWPGSTCPSPREERAARRRQPTTRGYVLDDLSMQLPRPRGRAAAARTARGRRSSSRRAGAGSEADRRSTRPAPARRDRRRRARAALALRADATRSPSGCAAASRDAVRLRAPRAARTCGAGFDVHRDAAARPRAARRRSCSRDTVGYCQQFSGAMALLLRMGGVPARVAAGFSPGTLDRTPRRVRRARPRRALLGRGVLPRLGWVTFDPTPAIAPPRAPGAPARPPPSRRPTGRPTRRARGDVSAPASGPGGARPATTAAGRPQPWMAVVAAALVLAAALAVRRVAPRRRRPRRSTTTRSLRELERALRRTGRTPPAGTTLRALETIARRIARRARLPARAARPRATRGRGRGPTRRRSERRALRRELAPGLGLRGRLRAWWALPPRLRAAEPGVHSGLMDEPVYDLFRAARDSSRTATSTRRRCRCSARATSSPTRTPIREALGRALFRAQRYERGRRGVRGRRRARADQRLRALLPRPLAAAAGPPRRGAPPAGAGRAPAAGAQGLREVPATQRGG